MKNKYSKPIIEVKPIVYDDVEDDIEVGPRVERRVEFTKGVNGLMNGKAFFKDAGHWMSREWYEFFQGKGKRK